VGSQRYSLVCRAAKQAALKGRCFRLPTPAETYWYISVQRTATNCDTLQHSERKMLLFDIDIDTNMDTDIDTDTELPSVDTKLSITDLKSVRSLKKIPSAFNV